MFATLIFDVSSYNLLSSCDSFWSISVIKPSPRGPKSGCLLAASNFSILAKTMPNWCWYLISSLSRLCFFFFYFFFFFFFKFFFFFFFCDFYIKFILIKKKKKK